MTHCSPPSRATLFLGSEICSPSEAISWSYLSARNKYFPQNATTLVFVRILKLPRFIIV
jgi:hypothetical protein